MRLGEVLVEAAVITREQLAEALRAQVVWGARLGTNLVELGHISLDDLAKALGKLHQLPAALSNHFDRADPALQQKLPATLAQQLACVPLVMANKHCVVALLAPPLPSELAQIATALGVTADKLVPAIAGELRIRFQLEKVYDLKRDQRFVRAKGTRSEESQLFRLQPTLDPQLEKSLLDAGRAEAVPLVDADPPPPARSKRLSTEAGQAFSSLASKVPLEPPKFDPFDNERRSYLRTLAEMLEERGEAQHSVMAHMEHLRQPAQKPAEPPTLKTATQWIFKAPDRQQVAHRVIASINKFVPAARAAIFLVVRGQCAVSWTSFCRDGTQLPPIAVPLDHPGLVPVVMRRGTLARSSSGDLNDIDFLLLASLGARHGELVIAPIPIADQVISVIGLACEHRSVLDGLEQITTATGAAFARLMRDAGATA